MKKVLLPVFAIIIYALVAFVYQAPCTDLTEKAHKENKNIVVCFSGCDWCSVCNKFKKNVLAQPEVKSLLTDDFVYYVADFPQRTKLAKEIEQKNDALAGKLNSGGTFPLLVIADKDMKIIKVLSSSATAVQAQKSLAANK